MIRLMVIVGVLLCAFALVGTMDYDDAIAEQEYYCSMVAQGYWPKHGDYDCD